MNNESNKREFQELADAWIDGRATEEQGRRLEQMASESPEFMRHFVHLSMLNASLIRVAEASPISATRRENASRRLGFNNWFSSAQLALAIAAVVLIALTVSGLYWRSTVEKETFASLDSIAGTRWVSASVPTDTGSQIGRGRMKLSAGLVTIRFDVGAVLELEGPADLEIINPTRCRLNSGKLLTTVHTDYKGFVVETPNAILTDQGTVFCVSVQQDGESEMHVLEGRVDVEDRTTGKEKTVLGKNGVRLSPGKITESHDIEQGSAPKSATPSDENRSVYLTTSMGRGADFWVQRDGLRPGSESASALPLLLVKWSMPDFKNFDRKSYLRFDLSSISPHTISNASLHLNAAPSGLGFASLTIDSSFAVYGITDDLSDSLPTDATWDEAPASTSSGGSVDTRAAQLLGRFVIPQGVQEGPFSVQSTELVDYLSRDQNQIATLVLVCETRSVKASSLVFGFAASNNASLSPPTLRLELTK
jgi:hypothetical protein